MKHKKLLQEYYYGSPDNISEIDPEAGSITKTYYYDKSDVIAFGYFQTSLDGSKEFMYRLNTPHIKIAEEAGDKLLGKALNSELLDYSVKANIKDAVYNSAAYTGRVFLEPKVVTTWSRISSEMLSKIVSQIKGAGNLMDYTYLSMGMGLGEEMSVGEYINGGFEDGRARDSKNLNGNIADEFDKNSIDFIRNANAKQISTLDQQLSKAGMTRAEYNFWKMKGRGESKEPKKVMKENKKDMKNKMNNEEFLNYIEIMTEALNKNDFESYDYIKTVLDEAVDEKRQKVELMKEVETNNFGILNHIFESELPRLIKTNKKAVRDVIKTIKEDKNLIGEFNFYNVLKNQYSESRSKLINPKDIVLEMMNVANVDKKTLMESNRKLRKVLKENGVVPSDFVDDESRKLYESGHILLSKERNSKNLFSITESFNVVSEYVDKHKKKDGDVKTIDSMIESFENSLKENLNESEMSFVKQITDFKSPIAEQRKEKLFNKFKNECIDKLNKMLAEDSSNTELVALKSQLEEQKFNKETIVKDIAKLLEIRDILMDD